MSTFQDVIKQDYLIGVTCLSGGLIHDDEILKKIDAVALEKSDTVTTESIAEAFSLYTKQLLKYQITSSGTLEYRSYLDRVMSSDLQGALSESFALKIWEFSYPEIENPRRYKNPQWMEMQISDIMIDLMDCRNSFFTWVQTPGMAIQKMQSISYKEDNLLGYLNYHLFLAREAGAPKFDRISNSLEVINCVEALSDCSEHLDMTFQYKGYQK